MTKPTDSPVIALLRHVWCTNGAATSHSWERMNQSMTAAMELAINSGMEFEATDFSRKILKDFNVGYWWGGTERYYTLAVMTGNLSAAKAIETYLDSQAFIADEVSPPSWQGCFAHTTRTRKRGRLAIGFSFPWKGEAVTVTSFSGDGKHLVACSYKERAKGSYSNTIKRSFEITPAAIKEDRAERRKAINAKGG